MKPIKELLSLGQDVSLYADDPLPGPSQTPQEEGPTTSGTAETERDPLQSMGAQAAEEPSTRNSNTVKNLLSKVENLNLGKESVKKIKDLAAKQIPLTGRQVAHTLEDILKSMQRHVSETVLKSAMEQAATGLHATSLEQVDTSDFIANLSTIPEDQLTKGIEEKITESEVTRGPSNPETPLSKKIEEAQSELEKLREKLGGSPNFPNQSPSYNLKSKKFFGIPLESCSAWCRKKLEAKTFPPFLWKTLLKSFDKKEHPETPFERAYLYLESLRLIALNEDSIKEYFRLDPSLGEEMFTTISRLACHPGQNGGSNGMILNIETMLELFPSQFENAKQNEALTYFFSEVTKGVCFEDRLSILTNHAMANQPEAETVALDKIIDHRSEDDMLTALIKEVEALSSDDNEQEQPYGGWENIRDHLVSAMVGLEREEVDDFGTPLGSRRAITPEDIERLRETMNGILFFED